MKGAYKIELTTPVGKKSGTLVFSEENGNTKAIIDAAGSRNLIDNIKTAGNAFEFEGTLNFGFISFEYTVKGTADGEILTATANTKYGVFNIKGTRTE